MTFIITLVIYLLLLYFKGNQFHGSVREIAKNGAAFQEEGVDEKIV